MKKYICMRWKECFMASLFLCLNVLSATICSFALMSTIDAITAGDKQKVLRLLLGQALIWMITVVTYYLGGVWKGKAQKAMNNDMRHDISNILMRKSHQQYEEHAIGDYISWYSNDVAQIEMWALNSFFSLVTCMFQVVITAVSLFLIHWVLVIVALMGGVLLMVISVLFEKRITEKANATSKVSEVFYSGMKNLLSGFTVMKNFHIMNEFEKQADECSEEKSETDYQYTKVQVTSNTWLLFCDAAFRVLIIGICAFLILDGKLGISAIVGVSNFMPKIFDGLTDAVCYKNSIVAAKPYFEKFEREYRKSGQKKEGLKELEDITQNISMKHVGYSYGEKTVLKDLNFQIHKGKKYALVGSSGSGKTTLMKILLGQLQGYEGEIFYDNIDATEYEPETITDKIAYIEQNVYLFDTTIRNNITLWEDFSEEKIKKALKESALFEDMKLFPQGLDTSVGENGKNLSGGQRQRIAVARALIHDKKILFIDEGTSALDQQNAKIIETKLLKNQDLTLLLISHHLDEERKAQFDEVFELSALA